VQDDVVARLDVGDFRPGLNDDPAALVAEEMRQIFIGSLDPFDFAELRAANPTRLHLHEHLAIAGRGYVDLVNEKGLALFHQDRG
jgi:hypothetical protein